MAFFEERMNPDLTFGARGGPVFSTSKSYSQSGRRTTVQNWTYPLHRYDVAHCIKTQSDFAEVINMFYVVAGMFDGFRFKDWRDFKHNDNAGTGILTLVSTGVYQMVKTYSKGNRAFGRIISKPVTGIQVFRTRSMVTTNITGTDATVTLTTGRVAITNHVSGDTYTWTGEFDVPVAFMSDEFMPEIANREGDGEFLINSGPIMLEEIRV